VCEVLQERGFAAYVVGGAVRDLLLGLRPKDFDVATDASPEDVHKIFRRSRLIGRRFKLVHVLFGEETVEVSTFRARVASETDEHGRVLRDNIYGTLEDDAIRRDFTINALYYDPTAETILDYHNGMRDLQRKSVRVIGDARARYREDPIRMLRAVRFAAKAGFEIDERTRKPIHELAHLLENVPPSRVYEEMQKLLLSGHAATALASLRGEACTTACCPCSTSSSSSPWASASCSWPSRKPTTASARARACRRRSCSPRCCGTRCSPPGRRRTARA